MKTNHTKGNWEFIAPAIVSTETNEDIALIKSMSMGANRNNESLANAKLIAAAPDMLIALQKAVEVIERMSDEYSAIAGHHASYTNGEAKIIEGAIKKAAEE
jgi:hypothetical protein